MALEILLRVLKRMLLNDLRWTAEMNLWYEFLNILEGQLVYLAEQKSHFDQDIVYCLVI